jgi:hypothetical protein
MSASATCWIAGSPAVPRGAVLDEVARTIPAAIAMPPSAATT